MGWQAIAHILRASINLLDVIIEDLLSFSLTICKLLFSKWPGAETQLTVPMTLAQKKAPLRGHTS